MILKEKKEFSDPLSETGIPDICQKFNWNHHSPSQAAYPDGNFAYRYWFTPQDVRRQFEGNANMAAGVAINNAIQFRLAEKIWKLNPSTKKLSPYDHTPLEHDVAIQKVQEEFARYIPVNEKDQIKFNWYRETIPSTISQLEKACELLGVKNQVIAENVLSLSDPRLLLPIIGRSDLEYQLKDFSSLGSHIAKPPFGLLEIKTSHDRPSRMKKDGTYSFVNAKVPTTPSRQHLLQVAFYKKCKPDHFISLVYVVKDDFKIFDKNNCGDLQDENLENYYEQLVTIFRRRERLMLRYAEQTDKDKIIKELVQDLDPQFDHNFCWSIGSLFVNDAKKLWNC
jgi:hypothetical protein|tara:strand:+ start:268 stop:1281 length:1014 start_codon:yes stop_codon:yes gene_type:complete